jgi:hypothetical protein
VLISWPLVDMFSIPNQVVSLRYENLTLIWDLCQDVDSYSSGKKYPVHT